jgi:hypothetical protein
MSIRLSDHRTLLFITSLILLVVSGCVGSLESIEIHGEEEQFVDEQTDAYDGEGDSDVGGYADAESGEEADPDETDEEEVEEGEDVDPPEEPEDPIAQAPCDNGSCWMNAPALSGNCGTMTIAEDFSSGLYNVHRYPLTAPAGVSVDLTLRVTNGSWSPALVILTTEGTTVYDGEVALIGGPAVIEPLQSGWGHTTASVRVTAPSTTQFDVFVTSWAVVESSYTAPMSTNVTYTMSAFADCPAPAASCPLPPASISYFGSGYFTSTDSSDPNSPNYNPYKRDSRTQHSGYDLHAPHNVPVLATEDGTIISATTTNSGDCGRSINLATNRGVTFRYCHLEQVQVTGGVVTAGQQIGLNGNSGNAINPHVHFVYLDAPNVTGSGTTAQRSDKVNAYIDHLCL